MIMRRLAFALALAAFILATAAALDYAEEAGEVSADSARRAMQVVIGLVLAAYANLLPKQLGRTRNSPSAEARSQSALRVGGWSMTLAGLAYAALWAFAPLPVADVASMAVVAASLAATLGYALWAYAACRAHSRSPLSP